MIAEVQPPIWQPIGLFMIILMHQWHQLTGSYIIFKEKKLHKHEQELRIWLILGCFVVLVCLSHTSCSIGMTVILKCQKMVVKYLPKLTPSYKRTRSVTLNHNNHGGLSSKALVNTLFYTSHLLNPHPLCLFLSLTMQRAKRAARTPTITVVTSARHRSRWMHPRSGERETERWLREKRAERRWRQPS